jgi:hypothetical protein
LPLNAARESPKAPIEPLEYVEPPVGYYGQALTPEQKSKSDVLKAAWVKRRADGTAPPTPQAARAAAKVLIALGYAWDQENGWRKP